MPRTQLAAPEIPPFDLATRAERVAGLQDESFDVLVIGGGITGAGIARDAAMRGLRTLLVEKGDLASGTSSASSKLVHGGLRYLEQREVGLVFESVSERHRLRQLAPHLVRPIPFLFPIFEKKPRPLWQVGSGLWIYDAMALFRSYRLHRTYRGKRAAQLEPAMGARGLDGCVLYYDCMTDDARLTLETARGAHDAGATVLTRCRVTSFRTHRSQVCGAEVVDGLTGAAYGVEARVVVNATGPWTDRTLGLRGDRPTVLKPTKGVHLVVSRARLPVQHAVCLFSPEDRRGSLAIPTGSRVLIGTTDTEFDGDFDDVHCQADDVSYLLGLVNRYFPDAHLGPADVLGSYAGLRPLVQPEEGGVGMSQISREHTIQVADDGLVTVAGGKLTTYRRMAAEVVEATREQLHSKGVRLNECTTGKQPLVGGGEPAPIDPELMRQLGRPLCDHLRGRHGSDWDAVAQLVASRDGYADRVVADLPYVRGELVHALREEGALTLQDLLVRRTDIFHKASDQGLECLDAVTELASVQLGWDDNRCAAEKDQYSACVALSRRYRDR